MAGEGPPTENEEQIRGEAAANLAPVLGALQRSLHEAPERAIAREFADYTYLPHPARAQLWRAFSDFTNYIVDRDEVWSEETHAIAGLSMLGERYGRYLNGVIELLGLDAASVEPVEWALMVGSLLEPICAAIEMEQHGGRGVSPALA